MKKFKAQRKGFTLIELMTAVAITTVIIGVLIGTTRMSMDAWQESRDKARASRLAKESMEVMARDLEGIVIRSGNDYEWLYAKMDGSEQQGPHSSAQLNNPLEFVFLTAATDRYDGKIGTSDDKGGDISTVIYKLVYKDQFEGVSSGTPFPVFSLYRKLINPDETFNKYLAQTSIQGLTPSDEITDPNNFIAENVYNLTVTLVFEYIDTNTGVLKQKRVPIMTSGSSFVEVSIKGDEVQTPGSSETLPVDARLAGAELGIMVLNDTAVRQLSVPSLPDSRVKSIIKENSHFFTKSVVLPRP
ncbi:type II secretion system protein J [Rubritalea tangerina]|uniref:Type II secretion system protein J n=2 Tax=Rubritalea tangerina TaxID=430798 RepID=A0ABW4ZEF6_9BACT